MYILINTVRRIHTSKQNKHTCVPVLNTQLEEVYCVLRKEINWLQKHKTSNSSQQNFTFISNLLLSYCL